MNDQELAQQVAVMPCLIAVIKTNHFDDAIGFLDRMSDLQRNMWYLLPHKLMNSSFKTKLEISMCILLVKVSESYLGRI